MTTVTSSITSGNNLSQYSKIDKSGDSPFSSCSIIVRSLFKDYLKIVHESNVSVYNYLVYMKVINNFYHCIPLFFLL